MKFIQLTNKFIEKLFKITKIYDFNFNYIMIAKAPVPNFAKITFTILHNYYPVAMPRPVTIKL